MSRSATDLVSVVQRLLHRQATSLESEAAVVHKPLNHWAIRFAHQITQYLVARALVARKHRNRATRARATNHCCVSVLFDSLSRLAVARACYPQLTYKNSLDARIARHRPCQ